MSLTPLYLVHTLIVISEQGLHHSASNVPVRRLQLLHQLLGAFSAGTFFILNHAKSLLYFSPGFREIVDGG